MTKASDTRLANRATATAFLIVAQHTASKSIRDGLFLEHYAAASLPYMYAAAALTSLVLAFALSWILRRSSTQHVVPFALALNGSLFLCAGSILASLPGVAAGLLYLQTASVGVALISVFWSLCSELFDPRSARQFFRRIVTGATFGGLSGGAVAWLFSDRPPWLLLAALGVANFGCVGLALSLTPKDADLEPQSERTDEFREASGVPPGSLIRSIAVLVVLISALSVFSDYYLKANVDRTLAPGTMVAFFSAFHLGTGLISLFLQALLTPRAIEKLGTVGTLSLLPLAGLLLGGANVVLPSLLTAIVLRGSLASLENSTHRSSFELLFAPLPAELRRRSKILVDVASDRLGVWTASCLIIVIPFFVRPQTDSWVLASVIILALSTLLMTLRIRRHYVGTLAAQLPPISPLFYALPLATGRARSVKPVQEQVASSPFSEPESRAAFVADCRRQTQESRAVPYRLAFERPPAFPGLSAEDLVAARIPNSPMAGATATSRVGSLADVALSARYSQAQRERAVELLSQIPTSRAVSELAHGLHSKESFVRGATVHALLQIHLHAPSLTMPSNDLLALASRELGCEFLRRRSQEAPASWPPWNHGELAQLPERLRVILAALATLDPSIATYMAFEGVFSSQRQERGAALELLNNTLPESVRGAVLSALEKELRHRDLASLVPGSRPLVEQFAKGSLTLSELRAKWAG